MGKYASVIDRDERLIRALPAFDFRFPANSFDEIISACGRISHLAGNGALEAAGEHIQPTLKASSEEGDLVCFRRLRVHGGEPGWNRASGVLWQLERAHATSNLRPLSIEGGQPLP